MLCGKHKMLLGLYEVVVKTMFAGPYEQAGCHTMYHFNRRHRDWRLNFFFDA